MRKRGLYVPVTASMASRTRAPRETVSTKNQYSDRPARPEKVA
jgi:hypothetical protein